MKELACGKPKTGTAGDLEPDEEIVLNESTVAAVY
jgi:hypothetical protein